MPPLHAAIRRFFFTSALLYEGICPGSSSVLLGKLERCPAGTRDVEALYDLSGSRLLAFIRLGGITSERVRTASSEYRDYLG